MRRLRKWWRFALGVALLVIPLQAAAFFVARTRRVHSYLEAHLERAFGRSVQVGSFNVSILPIPQLDADGLTVGEDPAFGNEYFLRAEHLAASLSWMGLLRGRIEFGTLSLSKPSLILVRNIEGNWNLERWLPPAKAGAGQSANFYGPPAPAPPVNRLRRIKFDEGRINFKSGNEKQPFAFTNVSGVVEQVSPGRWQLQIGAQPWRSGVELQATGTIKVRGDVAGTSVRLRPARIAIEWREASLADVIRLFHGQDYGVRGVFSMDAAAKSGDAKEDQPGDWKFSMQVRLGRIHRWDLTERPGNPGLNVSVNGYWNLGTAKFAADRFSVEGPRSNLRGTMHASGGNEPALELRLDSMGIQAADLLEWYRAFQADVAEGVTAEQYFTGGIILRGWPLALQSAALSSSGGTLRVPGLSDAVHIGPLSGGQERTKLVSSVGVAVGDAIREKTPKTRRTVAVLKNTADLTFSHDLNTQSGSFSIAGSILNVEDFLKLAAALGRPPNHGWELSGQAICATKWEWNKPFQGRWNGRIGFNNATLTVVGLNQPLHILEGELNWIQGRRVAHLSQVEGIGSTWKGIIEESPATIAAAENGPAWKFHLSAGQLDAADLDRWVGPRARPNWLQQLLAPLLGRSAPSTPASELVRRVNAEGELQIAQLVIEKLRLEQLQAWGSLRHLQLHVARAEANWAGGKIRATMDASFLPRPVYEISATIENVNLEQLPGAGKVADRVAGLGSGALRLKTMGVGREELLQNLTGSGDFRLQSIEFRGWDVNASVAAGVARAGTSRWASGEGSFLLNDRRIQLQELQLGKGNEWTLVSGTLSFARDVDLAVETAYPQNAKKPSAAVFPAGNILKISGPLDGPTVSIQKGTVRQPAD